MSKIYNGIFKNSIALCKLLSNNVNFMFDDAYKYMFNELKKGLNLTPIV